MLAEILTRDLPVPTTENRVKAVHILVYKALLNTLQWACIKKAY